MYVRVRGVDQYTLIRTVPMNSDNEQRQPTYIVGTHAGWVHSAQNIHVERIVIKHRPHPIRTLPPKHVERIVITFAHSHPNTPTFAHLPSTTP